MASLAFTECGETVQLHFLQLFNPASKVEDTVETRALVSGVLITDL